MDTPPTVPARDCAAFIDEHWNFGDPAATEAVFRSLSGTPFDDDPEFKPQLLTQIARTQGLQRRFDEATETLKQVEAMIDERHPVAAVRLLLERGRVLRSSGRPEASRPIFLKAWERAVAIEADFYAVDAAHMLGLVEEPATARPWNLKALARAEASEDPRARNWVGSLCNNIGWSHHHAGEFEAAMKMFERALHAREAQGKVADIRIARWCVARCHRSLGHFEKALAAQQELSRTLPEGTSDGYIDEELGECLLALGRDAEAVPHFARAHELLSRDAWLTESEPKRIERLKTLGRVED